MELYKLTNLDGTTRNNTSWEVGATNSLPKIEHPILCSKDVFHLYKNANLAFFINPIHADIKNARLFKCEGEVVTEDWGKVGCFSLKVLAELSIPTWVNSAFDKKYRRLFAVLCAESVAPAFLEKNPATRDFIEAAIEFLKTGIPGKNILPKLQLPINDTYMESGATVSGFVGATYACANTIYSTIPYSSVFYKTDVAHYVRSLVSITSKLDASNLADKAVELIMSNKQELDDNKEIVTMAIRDTKGKLTSLSGKLKKINQELKKYTN